MECWFPLGVFPDLSLFGCVWQENTLYLDKDISDWLKVLISWLTSLWWTVGLWEDRVTWRASVHVADLDNINNVWWWWWWAYGGQRGYINIVQDSRRFSYDKHSITTLLKLRNNLTNIEIIHNENIAVSSLGVLASTQATSIGW